MLGALSWAWLASAAALAGTPELAVVHDGVVHVGTERVAAGSAPAVSPDGGAVAFVSARSGNRELYVARLPGGSPVRITFTPRAAEDDPDWSPDGKRLVYASGRDLNVTTLDRSRTRLLVRRGASPAWSPDGRRIAFERSGAVMVVTAAGAGARRVAEGAEPAWAPDGKRLAYEADGGVYVAAVDRPVERLLVVEDAHAPAWSPDGRVAFERDGAVWAIRARRGREPAWVRRGSDPDWRPRPGVPEVLPDLDQLVPRNLSVIVATRRSRTRFLLGFESRVVNAGPGPLEILASRPDRSTPVMTGAQRVRLANGLGRLYPNVGLLRYKHADDHLHWHYLAFEAYELRRPDGSLAVRDQKRGFCLTDRRPPPGRRPVFTADCASHDPSALRLREGTSPGFTDLYPAHYHGQNVDVTDVPAGLYVLVHRANPLLYLREADYTNNAASLLIRLSWPGGRLAAPELRILRRCPAGDRCFPRRVGARAAQSRSIPG